MTRNMEHTHEVFVEESRVSSMSMRSWICLAASLRCSEDAVRTRNSFVCAWNSVVPDTVVELARLSTNSASSRCNVCVSECMSAFSDAARAGLPANGDFSSRGKAALRLFIASTSWSLHERVNEGLQGKTKNTHSDDVAGGCSGR